MSNTLAAMVALFQGSRNTTPVEHATLRDVLERIHNGTYRRHVEHLWKLLSRGDASGYRASKERSVAFTPCCDLFTRDKDTPWSDKLLGITQMVHFDYDHLGDPHGVKARLAESPSLCFAFISPSGRGLKVGFAASGITDMMSYRRAWQSLSEHLRATFPDAQFSEDPHVKFLHALCFTSWDADLFVRENPEIFIPPPLGTPQKSTKHFPTFGVLGNDCARVASALDAIPNNDADYDTWLRLGMALHSTGAPWARALWDVWSARSSKYNQRKQDRTWQSFHTDGATTLGTLFQMAKDAGWRPPGQRRDIVRHPLAGTFTSATPEMPSTQRPLQPSVWGRPWPAAWPSPWPVREVRG